MARVRYILLGILLCCGGAVLAAPLVRPIHVERQLSYGRHDGVDLVGDLYRPQAPGRYPVLVAVHGGDWRFADSTLYQAWGPYLARHGYALFAINYRLAGDG
jgi:dipeptidyl aminopeptidase/acylaminoacyl peptidase